MNDHPFLSSPGGARRRLRIALIGTRGPGQYGGFETCVEEVGKRLASLGHDVTVYCRDCYFKDGPSTLEGMRLVKLPCLQGKSLETISHTFLSVVHALFCNYDAHMIFSVSNAPLGVLLRLFGKRILINPDGLDWKRGKWGPLARTYIKSSEWVACHAANRLITDAAALRDYYLETYGKESTPIPYGAYPQKSSAPELLEPLGLKPGEYFLQITRFEPENNPLLTAQAFSRLDTDKKLVLVGGNRYPNEYVRAIEALKSERVVLPGFIYEPDLLRELWCNCFAYVHGNEVGGTNPALLQAMASGCFVISRDVRFNREVLADTGIFYAPEMGSLLEAMQWALAHAQDLGYMGQRARARIQDRYDWDSVALAYLKAIEEVVAARP